MRVPILSKPVYLPTLFNNSFKALRSVCSAFTSAQKFAESSNVEMLKDDTGKNSFKVILQSDQNMMKPELSGIHMNSSFAVSSYSGQMV